MFTLNGWLGIRKTNMRQMMRRGKKKDMKDHLAGTSIIYTLFLNCLYLLFICCSRQLCSGEMVTNARDRLATTGQLWKQPSVSGLLSLLLLWHLPLFPHRLFHPAQMSCTVSLVGAETNKSLTVLETLTILGLISFWFPEGGNRCTS